MESTNTSNIVTNTPADAANALFCSALQPHKFHLAAKSQSAALSHTQSAQMIAAAVSDEFAQSWQLNGTASAAAPAGFGPAPAQPRTPG